MALYHGLQLLLLLSLHSLVAARQVVLILTAVCRELVQHHVQPRLGSFLLQVTAQRLYEERKEEKDNMLVHPQQGREMRSVG